MRWHHIAVNLRTFTFWSNLIGLAKCLSVALCGIFSCNPCKPGSLQRNSGGNIRPEPVWCFCPQYLTSQKSWWKPEERQRVTSVYLQLQIDVPLSNMWIKKVWLMALSDHLSTSVIICYLRWPHTLSENYLRWPNAHSENSHSLQLMRPAGTWEEFNPRIQKAIQYKINNCAPGKNSHGME